MNLGAVYAAIVMELFSGPLSKWTYPSRRYECSMQVGYACAAHGCGLDTLLMTASTVAGESGCDPRAVSPDGQDCGIVQQRGVARHGRTCDELKSDPDLALDLWLGDLEIALDKCGSLPRALGVPYGGKCGARPALVRYRGWLVGLGPDLRIPDLAPVI